MRGLVRRPASASRFTNERFPVDPRLRPWFSHLWTVDWDLPDDEPLESTVISFPGLHLTAEQGRPGELRHGVAMPATLLHGTVSRVFRVRLAGRGAVVGAAFTAGGFPAWTGADAGPLADRVVFAPDNLGPALTTLHRRLAGLAPDQRASGLHDALLAAAGRCPPAPADEELTALVERVSDEPELVRVEQLVELSGWSARTLQRRFRRSLGVSPKWVLARCRLQEAALELERDPTTDLAALAVRLGWYDQAHLTNAFRRILGETPAQYAARSRPPP